MRAYLSFLILLTSTAFAEDTFEQRLQKLRAQQDKEVFQLGPKVKFAGKYPHPQYVEEYSKIRERHLAETFALHDEECKKSSSNCLTDDQKQHRKSQVRIDTNLVGLKNKWATDGKSKDEIKAKAAEYEAQTSECKNNNKDCDKVPSIETAGATSSTETAPSTQTADTTSSDTAPVSGTGIVPKRNIQGLKISGATSASFGTAVQVPITGDSRAVAGDGETQVQVGTAETSPVLVDPEQRKKDLEEIVVKIQSAVTAIENEYKAAKEKTPVTKEVVDAVRVSEEKKYQAIFKIYEESCKKYPNIDEACMSDEEKKTHAENSAGRLCFVERKHQYDSASDKSTVTPVPEISAHQAEWSALPSEKDCKVLLEKDKKSAEIADGDQEAEDKRNYQSDKCVWVTNIPRKVVTGVTCGKSKNNICIGYVSCPRKQGGGSFTRMSTCRASLCGNDDAVKCTQDPAYWSRKPSGEDKEYVSPDVKKILRTTRQ